MSNIIQEMLKDLAVGFKILYDDELYTIQSKYMKDDKEENGTTYVMYCNGAFGTKKRLEMYWSKLLEDRKVKLCFVPQNLFDIEYIISTAAKSEATKGKLCERCGSPLLSTGECSVGCGRILNPPLVEKSDDKYTVILQYTPGLYKDLNDKFGIECMTTDCKGLYALNSVSRTEAFMRVLKIVNDIIYKSLTVGDFELLEVELRPGELETASTDESGNKYLNVSNIVYEGKKVDLTYSINDSLEYFELPVVIVNGFKECEELRSKFKQQVFDAM